MSNMFCFQCQQTAKNEACTVSGVCGKTPDTSNLQDLLVGKLIALASATYKVDKKDKALTKLIVDGLFVTVTNVNFDNNAIQKWCDKVDKERAKYAPTKEIDMNSLWESNPDTRSLKTLILFGLKGVAAYAHHAATLGYEDDSVNNFFYKALYVMTQELSIVELLDIALETGNINLKCMELLDKANTTTYGNPTPITVSMNIEKGPFIVVTGHDLYDLQLLLKQTEGKGVNIYTHGEMLPCHGYPELKKYKHLKGNFGTAWQNQQKEFADLPAPVLFTTNCIMPVKDSYKDRIFTTSLVGYKEMKHIGADKDFTPVINKAIELGGYKETKKMTGINGGDTLLTGFGHNAILSAADKIIAGVKGGDIKHFFLVGGCDGAATGRNYYTDFVKKAPKDTIILTLACGKFRFNDLNIGDIGGIPRLLDMGQCNDAYGAIKVAVTLAEAFKCGVNDLPLTLVLSWYEQKAVCILLTLLALGVKNILIGPSLPAFVSPNVLNVLVEKWGLTPISEAEKDLNTILKKAN